MPWDELGKTILTALESVFTQQNLAIGHVKFSLKTSAGFLMGNLTGSGAGGELRGSAGQTAQNDPAELILNARVETDPARLQQLVETTLRAAIGETARMQPWAVTVYAPVAPCLLYTSPSPRD